MRSIAGDGSLRLTGVYQPLIYQFVKERKNRRNFNEEKGNHQDLCGTFEAFD